jgi:AhpD family alkylhydroperoxidase
MQTIQPIKMIEASDSALRLLEGENGEYCASNMLRIMAQSPRTLEGYMQFARGLAGSKIAPRIREQIALTVAQLNDCEYSLERHSSLAIQLGMTNTEILGSCEGRAYDRKAAAALKFARDLVLHTGESSAQDLRDAGFTDSEIIEVIGHVALNVFENYFNNVVRPDLDFPDAGANVRPAGRPWLPTESETERLGEEDAQEHSHRDQAMVAAR